MDKMATILKSTYTLLKGHGFATSTLTRQYQEIVQTLQGTRKNVTFNNIPDSGISSTTSITCDEDNKLNGNKRKIEEPLNDLDGTFTLVSSPANKTKSKSCTDQIMSKGGIGYSYLGVIATELLNGVFHNVSLNKNY